MNLKDKQTFAKALNYMNTIANPTNPTKSANSVNPIYPTGTAKKPTPQKSALNWPATEKPMETKSGKQADKAIQEIKASQEVRKTGAMPQEAAVSQERLQEAIIWSEILGKPISKRRKRREQW